MTALEKARKLVASLNRREKVRMLDWIVRDLGGTFPGIASTPGVAGGEPCVVRTRIPVWALVRARQLGASEADVLESYPSLRARVPFFFKQWGGTNKKKAGRVLQGRTWDQMPDPRCAS